MSDSKDTPEISEDFQKGYNRAKLEMISELEQLINYYYENKKRAGADAMLHLRTVIRSMKPYQKPWDPFAEQK